MFTETPRQFDLYDFFSVFVPGATVIIGLFPFLPSGSDIGSLGLLLPTIVLGFVFGRAIHNIGMKLDSRFGRDSHRDTFSSEIIEPNLLPENIVEEFYQLARDQFYEIGLPKDRTEAPEELLRSLYVATRGLIHYDSRGRSRTFQAVYAFFRSIEIAVIILAIIYYFYGFMVDFGLNQGVEYTSYIGTLGIPPAQFGLFGLALFIGSFFLSRGERWDYQHLYIEYLIMDYLLLKRVESK